MTPPNQTKPMQGTTNHHRHRHPPLAALSSPWASDPDSNNQGWVTDAGGLLRLLVSQNTAYYQDR